MSFEVTVLGSGAAVPTLRRNPSSQYVVCNDRHILIDCGEGTQIQMRKFGVKFQKITTILISHLHGDHFYGLVGLISTMHLMGRDRGLSIYGPPELKNILLSQIEIGNTVLDFDIDFVPIQAGDNKLIFEDRMIEIHTFPLRHRIPTHGFLIKEKVKPYQLNSEAITHSGLKLEHLPKLKEGKDVTDDLGKVHHWADYTFPPKPSFSYAYCSDTAYAESIVPFIQNATVLYHEATFTKNNEARAHATFHSTAEEAARIAKKANVGKLLIGHFSARYEDTLIHLAESHAIFPNSEVVEDGANYQIGH